MDVGNKMVVYYDKYKNHIFEGDTIEINIKNKNYDVLVETVVYDIESASFCLKSNKHDLGDFPQTWITKINL